MGRSIIWVHDPTNDVRYVRADENEADTVGATPIYIDANPAVSSSWGGRVNAAFTEMHTSGQTGSQARTAFASSHRPSRHR